MGSQKGLVRRVERKLESSVEDVFARIFGGSIVPEEVHAMVRREATDGIRLLPGNHILAPNAYVITLGVHDYEKLGTDPNLRSDAFAQQVARYLSEQGWQTYGDVVVRFERSPSLHTGQFRVRGTVDPDVAPDVAPHPPVGDSAPPQSDHALTAEPGVPPMTENSSYPGSQGQGQPADDYYDDRYGPAEDDMRGGEPDPRSSYPPPEPGGYPDQRGYPPRQPGPGGYPDQRGYPPRQPGPGGYPDQRGYPPRQPGPGGYPDRRGYPEQGGGYPPYEQRPPVGYGYDRGYDRGYDQGYGQGRGQDYEPGYDEGYGQTYDQGYDQGRDQGYQQRGGEYGQPAGQGYADYGRGPGAPDEGGYDQRGYPGAGYEQGYPGAGYDPYRGGGYDQGYPGRPGYPPQDYAGYGGYADVPPAGGVSAPPGGGYGDASPDYDYGQPAAGGAYDDSGQGGYAPARPTVTLQLDDGSGRTYQLREGTNIVGRGQDAQFRLPDTGVSRRHLEIRWDGQVALLSDLNSTNGTTVNNAPVQEWQLADGDVIRLGHSEIIVHMH
ncbi:FhaA domain-containing protein [Mycobacterium sp.]|uniref:FhaA domain-containing protein n=1 Tax=Mycobacterium sp. TaxID=1785 RepID=UPI001288F11F|nr:FhaA domain-containing protein [Mycobacterium sp.]KAA8966510.1 MAG: DUF2662 domain-containing protein [Mycobacterium sp.]